MNSLKDLNGGKVYVTDSAFESLHLYKQAGNSVTVNVIREIGRRME